MGKELSKQRTAKVAPVATAEPGVAGTPPYEPVQQAVSQEVSAILGQVKQARGILGDAIGRLSSSFTSLDEETTNQRALIDSLMRTLAGGLEEGQVTRINVSAFAKETSEVLQQFTELLAAVSKQSMTTVTRIDDMAEELNSVFKLVASINEIAEETFILAVNATIEAAHAGQAGRSFSVIAANVRELSKKTQRFNDQIGAQIGKARNTVNDLRQIIAAMASRDLNAAMGGKERVQQMLVQLEAFEAFVGQTLSQANGAAARIANATSSAVTALQFEDIVSQLLEGTARRAERIELLTSALGLPPPDTAAPAGVTLEHLNQSVQKVSSPVQQNSMTPGDVELF